MVTKSFAFNTWIWKSLCYQVKALEYHDLDISQHLWFPLHSYQLTLTMASIMHNDVLHIDISASLRAVATMLVYPINKGMPLDTIDTQSLNSGGTCILFFSRYDDCTSKIWFVGMVLPFWNTLVTNLQN